VTEDNVELPFGYGSGSSTMSKWLLKKARRVYHVEDYSRFPVSWGFPPYYNWDVLTFLPGGYGFGPSSLSEWIEEKMASDVNEGHVNFPPAFGRPPKKTEGNRELPFGYGSGSPNLKRWLLRKAQQVHGTVFDAQGVYTKDKVLLTED